MGNFLIYMIESAISMSILHLFYRYLYFKFADFERSRIYLLAALAFSIIVPALAVPEAFIPDTQSPKFILKGTAIVQFVDQPGKFPNALQAFLPKILLVIWFSGALPYLFIFFKGLYKIKSLSNEVQAEKYEKYSLFNTKKDRPCFSFFNKIFTGERYNRLSDAEQKHIIRHEILHARMLHSIDRILFELYRAIFWFNPFTKSIVYSIKEIHEFSVDRKLTNNRFNQDYSHLILQLASGHLIMPQESNFSRTKQIKHRIELIAAPVTASLRKKRFWISIPALLIAVVGIWFSSSIINGVVKEQKTRGEFMSPIEKTDYTAKFPFFENKTDIQVFGEQSGTDKRQIYRRLSHRQIDYKTKSYTTIQSAGKSTVTQIDTKNIQGLREISIYTRSDNGYQLIYEKLEKAKVKLNEKIEKGQIIGITGDSALYPIFTFKVIHHEKYIDPDSLVLH